jgi:hypothetical protein
MSSKWAEKLTRWWAHTHAGVRYTVDHLHPFRFSMELPATKSLPARTVEIRVGFSCHAFTRAEAEGDAGLASYHDAAHKRRMFCPVRHGLSLSLPDIVRELPGRNCYFARRDNYFVVEAHALLAEGQEYRVFFDVRNAGESDAVLVYVQSAYSADKERGGPGGVRRKKVGFRVLVNHALRGTKPTEPP